MVKDTAKLPVSAVTAVVPTTKSGQPDPAALQTELQRFSDEYLSRTVAALDDYAKVVGTTEARSQALVWKISIGSAVVSIVSGPNPTANLIDFIGLASVTRIALEENWAKSEQAKAFQPLQ